LLKRLAYIAVALAEHNTSTYELHYQYDEVFITLSRRESNKSHALSVINSDTKS